MYGTNLSVCVEHLNRYSYIQVTIFSKIDAFYIEIHRYVYIPMDKKRDGVYTYMCNTKFKLFFCWIREVNLCKL